jgi:hypothetical protein
MAWDGAERRSVNSNLETDIAVIKEQITHVRGLLEETRETQLSNTLKLSSFDSLKKDFDSHVTSDRWLFTLLVTLIIGVFVKIVTG